MNAVVLKIENNKAAVLDENGSFRIVEDKAYSRGQIIDLAALEYPVEDPETARTGDKAGVKGARKTVPFTAFISRHLSQAAAIIICIVLAGGMSVYAAPVKTVTSDITPSLSYQLNVFNRVVRVESTDEAYTDAVNELAPDIAGKKLESAVDITRTTLEKTLDDERSEEIDDEGSRGSDIDEQITDIDTDTDEQLPAEPAPGTGKIKPETENEHEPEEDMPDDPDKINPATPPEGEMHKPEQGGTKDKAVENSALNAAPSSESPLMDGFGAETGVQPENLREGNTGEMAAPGQENPPDLEGMNDRETDPGRGGGPEMSEDRDQRGGVPEMSEDSDPGGGPEMAEEREQSGGGPEISGGHDQPGGRP